MKRRYLHRKNWRKILKRDYKEMKIENEDFNGYIALLNLIEVAEPLLTKYLDAEVCIANNHYSWLQQLPLNENFAITTMFDDKGEIIEKDKDELLEALKNHEITKQQLDFAYQIFNQVLNHIQTIHLTFFR